MKEIASSIHYKAKKNSEDQIEADVANWLSRVDRMISQHSEKFLTNEGRANINCLSGKLLDLGSRHRMSRKAKKMAMEAAIEIQAAGEFHKDVGPAISPYGGPSSSQSAREQSLFTSSKEGALQCQSSVLDNDIGSSGPSVSGSLSIPKTGLGSVAAQKPSSSIQNLNSSSELKNDYEEASTENEESTVPSTSFSSVPTKSSEMDSKMLQQLDKLVSVMLGLVKITEAPCRYDTTQILVRNPFRIRHEKNGCGCFTQPTSTKLP
nr:uncharacterized protein LOC125421506 [Ziziphus jujuba var. spinosa]